MKKMVLLVASMAMLAAMISEASARFPTHRQERVARTFSAARPWHGDYAYTPNAEPTALVLPPTADSMASYSWGVAQTEINPLYHQFGRSYPSGGTFGEASPWKPTPVWPSHTDQFGVYGVRGPWR